MEVKVISKMWVTVIEETWLTVHLRPFQAFCFFYVPNSPQNMWEGKEKNTKTKHKDSYIYFDFFFFADKYGHKIFHAFSSST